MTAAISSGTRSVAMVTMTPSMMTPQMIFLVLEVSFASISCSTSAVFAKESSTFTSGRM